MVAHSAGVTLEAKAEGGILAGLKRSMLSGESFFVSTFTAPQEGGWVDVAPSLPGDMLALQVAPDRPYFISRGGWIANSSGVQVESKWGGFANLFGGEGGFGLRASGQGRSRSVSSAPSMSSTLLPMNRSPSIPAMWWPTTCRSGSPSGARSPVARCSL